MNLPVAVSLSGTEYVPIVQDDVTRRVQTGLIANFPTEGAQDANTVLAGPTSGSAAAPSFRALTYADLPISAPVTKTADFTVDEDESWLINNKSGSACTVTLPTASDFSGRAIMITNYQAQNVISASSDVVPLTGGAAGTAILSGASGRWATLVSDGTNWVIMQRVV